MTLSDHVEILAAVKKLRAEAGALFARCQSVQALTVGVSVAQVRDLLGETIDDLTENDSNPYKNHDKKISGSN